MIQRILVPTDGSELSERALAPAEIMARAHGAEVILLRVVEPFAWIGQGAAEGYVDPETYQKVWDAIEGEARASLEALVASLEKRGIQCRWSLLNGTPGAGLLDMEEQTKPDLVVIASHGRTGLARFALGSVADRLVREGTAPVMVVHSFTSPVTRLETALAPLDGSPTAEAALPMVEQLAGKPLRFVHLLRAVPRAEDSSEAREYLDTIRDRLTRTGLQVATQVRTAEPAAAIEQAAEDADVVILATHGRGGLDRLRHGSVAEQATRQLSVPALLVRAGMVTRAAAGLLSSAQARR